MLKLAVRHKVFDTQPRSQCASVAGLGKKWFLRLPPPMLLMRIGTAITLMFASHCLRKKFKSKHERK